MFSADPGPASALEPQAPETPFPGSEPQQVKATEILASRNREITAQVARAQHGSPAAASCPRRRAIGAGTRDYKYANYLEAWCRRRRTGKRGRVSAERSAPPGRRRAERLVGVRRVSAVGDEMPGHATRRQVIAGVRVPRGVRAGTNAGRRRQWPSPHCLHPKSDGPRGPTAASSRFASCAPPASTCWMRTPSGSSSWPPRSRPFPLPQGRNRQAGYYAHLAVPQQQPARLEALAGMCFPRYPCLPLPRSD